MGRRSQTTRANIRNIALTLLPINAQMLPLSESSLTLKWVRPLTTTQSVLPWSNLKLVSELTIYAKALRHRVSLQIFRAHIKKSAKTPNPKHPLTNVDEIER